MTIRTMIGSGRYLELFESIPRHVRWTPAQIEQSMRDTLRRRPESDDTWVFGYGSLIWNPVCRFGSQQKATLEGWHRSFCLRTIAGRASTRLPGRMLSLEPGGRTEGVVLRVPASALDEEMRLLWYREMPTGAYRPIWSPVVTADGTCPIALVFVADPNHHLYEPNSSVASVAPFVASAHGPLGTNAQCVFRLKEALARWKVSDSYVEDLVDAISRLRYQSGVRQDDRGISSTSCIDAGGARYPLTRFG